MFYSLAVTGINDICINARGSLHKLVIKNVFTCLCIAVLIVLVILRLNYFFIFVC